VAKAKKDLSYSKLKGDLDKIMAAIQDDSISVDESISLYEAGLKQIQQIEEYLDAAENKLVELKTKKSKA
jgi:exodeoxyribonuclease VII small subunit